MAIFKCKMCGGTLEISNNETVAVCEYCGTKQTLPSNKDEIVNNLFNRANNLRIKSEFDKAEEVYQTIIKENSQESEAYWGLILCKYGIEYVDDPKTHTRVPTCHRTSYDAIMTDADYLAAVEYADASQKIVYEEEAKAIDAVQKNILSVVKNEKPFDVFICYKETDENGKRTVDSTIANDIYHQLTQEGLKVFFAAITLEDKLGVEYEPYIFAALNSAKVMLAIGTKPEYFNAVWVKNEWSRFLKIMKNDRSKLLIPCYKDMDAYDLPEEFSHLQAQDMSKIGFINDVVRGIKKVASSEEKEIPAVKTQVIENSNGNVQALLDRGFMALEDGEWKKADDFFEQALNFDAKLAQAYLGKLMAELKVKTENELCDCKEPFDNKDNYAKVVRFGDEALKSKLERDIEYINNRNETERLEGIYDKAVKTMKTSEYEEGYKSAAKLFESIIDYKDSSALAKECNEKAEIARKDDIYYKAKSKMEWPVSSFEKAINLFQSISGWKDADEQIAICKKKIEEIKTQEKAKNIERERQEQIAKEERERKTKRNKKIAIIGTPIVCAVIVIVVILNTVIIPDIKYKKAVALMGAQKYEEAISLLGEIDYKDSRKKLCEVLEKYRPLVEPYQRLISASYFYTVGLKADGRVVAAGYSEDGQCDVSGWEDIVEISAGPWHVVGLKADGRVVAVGDVSEWKDDRGQCEVSNWKDIVAVSAGRFHTIGLKSNGTVVATGYNKNGQCEVSNWKDVVAISAGEYHTIGLKSDGTVVATQYSGDFNHGQCDVEDWTDIVAISAGEYHTIGLKSDGTVVATQYRGDFNNSGQCEVSNWKDIVAISAGDEHTIGLKSDGTVVATQYRGVYNSGQCEVGNWKDIVAISAGGEHTVGLKSDGTVVAVGTNTHGQCEVDDWKDIKIPDIK